MITSDKFREILQRLLEKSKAGKVTWGEVQGVRCFHLRFDPNSLLVVTYDSPNSSPDVASAALYVGGRVVVGLTAEDGGEDWDLLNSLYLDAERCVRGWDVALDTIERALQSNETIGMPE